MAAAPAPLNCPTSSSDEEWDTDLALEQDKELEIGSFYKDICNQLNIPVVSKVVKQIHTDRVDLNYYGVTDKDVQTVASTLEKCLTVTVLNLHDNRIGEKGASLVANMLIKNSFITCLDLSGNKIGRVGTCAIGEMQL